MYYDGPRTAEVVRDPVNTPFHDWLGYDAPEGVYNTGTWKDDRPNVGGLISPESFFSRKWLQDASEALCRLLDHLEKEKYADRIVGYHIAYVRNQGYIRIMKESLRELQLCGAPIDRILSSDLENYDFSKTKLVYFLNGYRMTPQQVTQWKQILPRSCHLMWLVGGGTAPPSQYREQKKLRDSR